MDNEGFTLPPKLYDLLKWVALVLLPAFGALYAALGSLWNVPAVIQIVGTIAALDTFLGLLLRRSSSNYQGTKLMGEMIMPVDQDGIVGTPRIVADREFIPTEGDVVGFKVRREQQLE